MKKPKEWKKRQIPTVIYGPPPSFPGVGKPKPVKQEPSKPNRKEGST